MDIRFPLEFVVYGAPLSLQAAAGSIARWKERVQAALAESLPQPYFLSEDRISVTLYYFPAGAMVGDIDNIVKPVLDALVRHVYVDDQQVERVLIQKFETEPFLGFANPTPTLVSALQGPKPVLYVRVSNDPLEELR